MNSENAQKLIVLATFITLGSTGGAYLVKPKEVKQEIKLHRAIAGGFFAMMGCSIVAEFEPVAGVGLAALVAGGAFFTYGVPALNEYYEEGTKKKK